LTAKAFGIKKMTFDSIEELHKISKDFPKAECILRIATEASGATYNLSEKFGAPMEDVNEILKTAKKLGLWVKGVAFHTGSGGVTFDAYQLALLNARTVFDMAE
jgi:ornithine decarboxylase